MATTEEQVSSLSGKIKEILSDKPGLETVKPGDLIPRYVPGSICARLSDEVRDKLRQLETKLSSDSGFGRVIACFDKLDITKSVEDDEIITCPSGSSMAYTVGDGAESPEAISKFDRLELVENKRPFLCRTTTDIGYGGKPISRVTCMSPIKLGPTQESIQKKIDKLKRDADKFNDELLIRVKKTAAKMKIEPKTYIDEEGKERASIKYQDMKESERNEVNSLKVRRLHLLGGVVRYPNFPKWPINVPGQVDNWPEVTISICKS